VTFSPLQEVVVVVTANAVIAWLATYLLHSTTTVAIGLLADRIPCASRDRAMLWRLAITMPFLTATAHVALAAGVAPLTIEISTIASSGLTEPALALVVLLVVAIAPVLLIAGLVRDVIRCRRAFGRRTPVSGPWLARLRHLGPAGRRQARLTASDRSLVPAAIGHDEICVPGHLFAALAPDEQQALLAHELGHLARRDPAWLTLAASLARLAFFQPLGRVALRRLREATEQAADDFAAALTRNPLALARALITMTSVLVAGAGSASAAGSPIYRRVRRLIEAPRSARLLSRPRILVLAAGTLAVLAIAMPGVSLSPHAMANRISWLTPSRDAPNPRMLEFRRVIRGTRNAIRRAL
jgi:beta-lactamase regulating signal transducer with metallopeptidase domain